MTASLHDDAMTDLMETLEITDTEERDYMGGTWVRGTIGEHRFEALVFPEHADNPDYELDDSRISKLWVQRIEGRATVANFDRGWDVRPATRAAERIVGILAAGLSGIVFQD